MSWYHVARDIHLQHIRHKGLRFAVSCVLVWFGSGRFTYWDSLAISFTAILHIGDETNDRHFSETAFSNAFSYITIFKLRLKSI